MCNRFSTRYGYICMDCFEELIRSGVKTDIEQFMRGEVKVDNLEASEAYFDKIFPDREW